MSEGPAAFRAAHARAASWHGALRACLDQLEPRPPGACLGLLYLGRDQAPFADLVLRSLREATGVTAWLGAAGHAALGGVPSHEDGRGLAVMLASMPAGSWRLLDPLGGASAPAASTAAIVHAELEGPRAAAALHDLAARTDAYLVGALSHPGEGAAQIAGGVGAGDLAALVLDRRHLALPLIARSGKPLGPVCRITSRVGERIFALDGRAALEVVVGRLGDLARARPERLAGELMLADAAPAVGRRATTARVVAIDRAGGSLLLEPSQLKGPEIVLLRRDPATARHELEAALDGLVARLDGRRVAAVVWYVGRARLARFLAAGLDEVAVIRSRLGHPPLIGLAADSVIVADHVEGSAGVGLVLT